MVSTFSWIVYLLLHVVIRFRLLLLTVQLEVVILEKSVRKAGSNLELSVPEIDELFAPNAAFLSF